MEETTQARLILVCERISSPPFPPVVMSMHKPSWIPRLVPYDCDDDFVFSDTETEKSSTEKSVASWERAELDGKIPSFVTTCGLTAQN